jgi:phosphoribosyl 1,2-cyclic phosphate phosphodiesterase
MYAPTLRVTILGCGSSGGVPRVGGPGGAEWGACNPNDPRNRRSRCGLLVEQFIGTYDPERVTSVLIDTSPDLRTQLLGAGVRRVDGVLFTHDHADQTHGIDDLRPVVYAMGRRPKAFLDAPTRDSLFRRFGYIFETPPGSDYPALLDAVPMVPLQSIVVEGPGGTIEALPLPQVHGSIDSLGFRIGPIAYCNDCSALPDATLAACEGAEVFIVDALRDRPHPSHAHVAQSLAWIARVKPHRAVLTNMHIDLDFAELSARLPKGVEPAVDGWRWEGGASARFVRFENETRSNLLLEQQVLDQSDSD